MSQDEDPVDLYENAPCGYLSIAADGSIVNANGTLLRWTGFTRQDLVGARRFIDLLSVGGRVFYETHFQPLLRMQGFVREVAFDLVCANGSRLPVLVNAAQRQTGETSEVVTRITVFDATDRRRYERELMLARNKAEELSRSKGDLIAMISHDVRAPLSAMLTAIALLEKTNPTAQQLRYLRVLQSSATHAVTLVSSVLDLSRLDAGQSVLRERAFDWRQLVAEVVAAARLGVQNKPALAITTSIDEQVPAIVVGDRGKLGQVLTNLVTNAVKFTDRGLVSVIVAPQEVRPDSVTLDVMVSDTGIGIPDDRLASIFNEFTQATDEISDKYGGTGLGLSITQKLLLLYGSELTVTSTLGQGSTFSFTLTLKRPSTPD
jgi:PAS domain S-box-containing protein